MGLAQGSPLVIENLDLKGLGLYLESEKDTSVPEEDWILTGWLSMGRPLWARKSDEGKKWHVYEDKEINLWPLLK